MKRLELTGQRLSLRNNLYLCPVFILFRLVYPLLSLRLGRIFFVPLSYIILCVMDLKTFMRLKRQQDNRSEGVSVPDARRWISLWMANRRSQLIENSGGVSQGNREARAQNERLYGTPAYSSLDEMRSGGQDIVKGYERSAALSQSPSERSVAEMFAKSNRGIYSMANDHFSKNPEVQGSHFSNSISRLAVALPPSHLPENLRSTTDSHQSVMVHELTHAMEPSPQENKITEIMKTAKLSNRDEYTDSPKEIYARIMQLRHEYDLDPNKTYSVDDIKELRKKGEKKFNILDRYDDETIYKLLNWVASTDKPNRTYRNA